MNLFVYWDQEGQMMRDWVGKGRNRNTFESNWCQTPPNVKRQLNPGVHSFGSILCLSSLWKWHSWLCLCLVLIQRRFSKVILWVLELMKTCCYRFVRRSWWSWEIQLKLKEVTSVQSLSPTMALELVLSKKMPMYVQFSPKLWHQ